MIPKHKEPLKKINRTSSNLQTFILQQQKSEKTIYKWEKILVSHVSCKSLVSRICKEPLQLKNKKSNNPVLKISTGFEWIFLQKRYGNVQ